MGLGIEDNLVQWHETLVIEEQEKVFERLTQKEALHFITFPGVRTPHVVDTGVAPRLHPRVPFEGLEDLPTPLTIDRVIRNTPKIKQGFQCFRTEQREAVSRF